MYGIGLSRGGFIRSEQIQHRLGSLQLSGNLHDRRMQHLGDIENLEARGSRYGNHDFDVLSAALNFLDAVDEEHGLRG